MPNNKELRIRIRSVKNTSQITKAMQMVAANKMRKAQNQALQGRPYSETLSRALSNLTLKVDSSSHPLFKSNDNGKVGIVLLSTDKSLCGALNSNLFRLINNFLKEQKEKDFIFYTIGKKGRQFVVKIGEHLEADFENLEIATFRQATQISKLLINEFLVGNLKKVYIAYPDFISTLRQEPTIKQLLPIVGLSLEEKDQSKDKVESLSEYLFEPDLSNLLEYTLNHFVETKIYQSLLETKASEHSARMMAMQNATDNAKELVEDLTLTYNQSRQDAITRELLEITSALAALE